MASPRSSLLLPAILALGVAGMLAFGALLGARYGPFPVQKPDPPDSGKRRDLSLATSTALRQRGRMRLAPPSTRGDIARLTEGPIFRGRLLDNDRRPLAGVSLQLRGLFWPTAGTGGPSIDAYDPLLQVVTASDGSFEIPGSGFRLGNLIAELPGADFHLLDQINVPGKGRDFVLRKAKELDVQVLDPAGEPAPWLRVQHVRTGELFLPRTTLDRPHLLFVSEFDLVFDPAEGQDRPGPDEIWESQTDRAGRFKLTTRQDSATVCVWDAAGFPHRYSIPAEGDGTVLLRLHRLQEVEFPVLGDQDEPLAGRAEIFVQSVACWGDYEVLLPAEPGATSETARAWTEWPEGARVVARRSASEPWQTDSGGYDFDEALPGQVRPAFRLAGPRPGVVVIQGPDGEPVPGVSLSAFRSPFQLGGPGMPLEGLRQTAPDRYRFDSAFQELFLRAEAPGYHPALSFRTSRFDDGAWRWTFEMHPARRLQVLVRRSFDASPVPGVVLHARCEAVESLEGPAITDRLGVWQGTACAEPSEITVWLDGRRYDVEWDGKTAQVVLLVDS